MWGGRKWDEGYTPWFAWHPVKLYGPIEWNRMRFDGSTARWVWMRWVCRMRTRPNNYYALPEDFNAEG